MNLVVDNPNVQVSGSESDSTVKATSNAVISDHHLCLIEVKQMPYLPDQQVELLHLQAEADALLLQLQAMQQKRQGHNVHLTGVR
jgi:hypothetical protein